jgi:plasmid maintenance system antidote protein VapI
MNTKLNNMKINPEYEALFSFGSKKEKIEHNAQMISYRILSEVEKVCEEKKIKKKALAEMVGTSRSYITQLFRGTKQVNTDIMARFEEALDISFQIKVKLNEESHEAYLAKQIPLGFFNKKRLPANGCVMYYFEGGHKDKTGEIVKRLETENKSLQTA